MSEKVHFQTNIPLEVALKYNDGKEVTGQYGDQVLYSLTDGRVMYVPPIVKKKIEEAGISRGELFTITKAEKKNGTRRAIEWVIGPNGGAPPEAATQMKAPSTGPTRVVSNSATGSTPQGNGNGRRTIPPGDPKGFLATGQGQFLLQAFSAAVDVAA
jgi:hypothetical protein